MRREDTKPGLWCRVWCVAGEGRIDLRSRLKELSGRNRLKMRGLYFYITRPVGQRFQLSI